MLMSMFSSIDAYCAESIGQKIGLSFAPAPAQASASSSIGSEKKHSILSNRQSSSDKYVKKGGDGNPSSPSAKANNQEAARKVQMRRARFAPELDGVYCFETIVPY